MKQLAKASSREQNTASTTQATARVGSSLAVALVGAALLVIGAIVSSGFLVTVGIIVLVVGAVLLVLSIL